MRRIDSEDRGLETYLRREGQLDLLAYMLVLALMAIAAILLVFILSDLAPPESWIFDNYWFRLLAPALIVTVVAYLADQHRRVRSAVTAAYREAQKAHAELQRANEHLAFAHQTTTVVADVSRNEGLDWVLEQAAHHFGADAVAVIDEDVTRAFTREGIPGEAAEQAFANASIEAVGAGAPLAITNSPTQGSVMAAPLRLRGRLESVVCAWRLEGAFTKEQLDGLQLVARIIELGLNNRSLLDETTARMRGTLSMLGALMDLRQPQYRLRSALVAELACSVARRMGLPSNDAEDIEIAALLHDIGMLQVPEEILNASRPLTYDEIEIIRRHPAVGAEMMNRGRFRPEAQTAVLHHHEHMDGSGYPSGLIGNDIPIGARIIAACDSYVALTTPRPHRQAFHPSQAAAILAQGAGSAYDPAVVNALLSVLAEHSAQTPSEGDDTTRTG